MESEDMVENRAKSKKALRNEKDSLCKNAELSIERPTYDDFKIINTGCTEKRRNGSSYCQKCADKYHESKK